MGYVIVIIAALIIYVIIEENMPLTESQKSDKTMSYDMRIFSSMCQDYIVAICQQLLRDISMDREDYYKIYRQVAQENKQRVELVRERLEPDKLIEQKATSTKMQDYFTAEEWIFLNGGKKVET